MATCRKVLVRKTVTTNTRIERSVAFPGSAWATVLGPGAPEGVFHFEPEEQGTEPEHHKYYDATEIRLELSEQEAATLIGLLGAQNDVRLKAVASVYDALMAVVSDGKDFATRRPKNAPDPWLDARLPGLDVDTVTVQIPRELLGDESVDVGSYVRKKLTPDEANAS